MPIKITVSLLISVLLFITPHCKRAETSTQPRGFESPGLRFTYPGNFKVTSQELEKETEQITLEAEQNLLIIITAFRHKSWDKLEDFAETVATERDKNIDDTLSVGTMKLAGTERQNFEPLAIETSRKKIRGLREKFSITLFGVKVPHISGYLRDTQGEVDVIYIVQSPTQTWAAVSKAFSSIAGSLTARPW